MNLNPGGCVAVGTGGAGGIGRARAPEFDPERLSSVLRASFGPPVTRFASSGVRTAMTWWTEEGNIVAPPPVFDLLCAAAAVMRDHIDDELTLGGPDCQLETGVRVFDAMEPKTRIFALAFVLRHLSDPALPSPQLYAWNEGTLWALFKTVESRITCEVQFDDGSEAEESRCTWRRLTLAALASHGHRTRPRQCGSRNLKRWEFYLELIYDHYFWDLDCLDDDVFGDLAPVRAEVIKDEMGIDPEYFSTPPPLVREDDYREADAYLQRCGGAGRADREPGSEAVDWP